MNLIPICCKLRSSTEYKTRHVEVSDKASLAHCQLLANGLRLTAKVLPTDKPQIEVAIEKRGMGDYKTAIATPNGGLHGLETVIETMLLEFNAPDFHQWLRDVAATTDKQ